MTKIFTDAENKEKKYTVKQAIDAARARLGALGVGKYELTDRTIRSRSQSDRITLAELNSIADQLVDDSTSPR